MAKKFKDLLQTFDLTQHVNEAAHQKGHTLDLILTCATDSIVEKVQTKDTCISDFWGVYCAIMGPMPTTVRKEISFRKIKAIDTDQFKSAFSHPP